MQWARAHASFRGEGIRNDDDDGDDDTDLTKGGHERDFAEAIGAKKAEQRSNGVE